MRERYPNYRLYTTYQNLEVRFQKVPKGHLYPLILIGLSCVSFVYVAGYLYIRVMDWDVIKRDLLRLGIRKRSYDTLTLTDTRHS